MPLESTILVNRSQKLLRKSHLHKQIIMNSEPGIRWKPMINNLDTIKVHFLFILAQ